MKKINYFYNHAKTWLNTLKADSLAVKDDYIAQSIKQNYFSVIVAAIITIALESYNIIYVISYSEGLNSLNNRIYFYFYVTLVIMSILSLIIQRKLKGNVNALYNFYFAIASLYLLWHISLNSYQINNHLQSSTLIFITALMGTMIIIRLKIFHLLFLLISSSILMFGLTFQTISYGSFVNSIIAISVILVAMFISYSQRISSLNSKAETVEINKQLESEQAQLRLSLNKYKTIMSELDLFNFDWNFETDSLVFSSSFASVFQAPRHINDPWNWFKNNQFIHEDETDKLIEKLGQCISKKSSFHTDMRILNNDNEYVWYHLRVDIQYSDEGKPTSAIGSLQNINNIKKFNEELTKRVNRQIEGTNDYFNYLKATQEKVLKYHHDMRHILMHIDQLVAKQDMQALQDLTSSARNELDDIQPNQYCENNTVNLILGAFEQIAQKDNVKFIYNVSLPTNLFMSSLSLCTIFFNLLENSLFAVRQVENNDLRKINIEAYIKNNKLIINTRNYFNGTVEMHNDIPISKNTKSGHGLGVKNIIDAVESYDGMYIFKNENQVFTVNLLIPLQ